ncbi:HNH endonuclease signature motif containing protein [Pseudomonas sp. BN606]|uniref:HNH endonuclease n=1 Tax=Pseudomonas sp. BN606 TaxID=2567894 RepID=UPI002453A4C6|nr:HNH endonuclease signature motif containing protein [Pseudomonas sp. BN606]MDH4651417.1 HNH endonuclease [Pseudomonas sp. BN606]
MGDGWSGEELRASVKAYLEIAGKVRAGQKVTKKAYYDALAEQFGRTAKSFEFRMQNISYVLSLMGRDWLPGLKPKKNVGTHMAALIESFINDIEQQPSAPVAEFEKQVREKRGRYKAPPEGQKKPEGKTVSITQYERDPAVKAWVLDSAKGHCECCGNQAPFLDSDGLPFLEVHHVRRLADGGSDTVANAVAICPNCHRGLHYAQNAKGMVEALYIKIGRLVLE